jgi:peroxiredoxin
MRKADLYATLAVLLIGGPLVFMFASAFVDGEARRREAPLRALLGNAAYDALSSSEPIDQHYMGDDRLAPDFSLQRRDGSAWRLSEHRGRVLVLNFWTVTCGPCVEEMPTLEDLARVVENRDDIELVTISVDRDWDTVSTVVPASSPIPVLLDPDRSVVRGMFGTRLFPETWIVDPRGVIRLRVDGARDWSTGVALDAIRTFF